MVTIRKGRPMAEQEHFDAMRLNPVARPHMEAIAAIAHFDPILCEVSESVTASE